MSAIAGNVWFDSRPAARTDIEVMLNRLHHRGPDSQTVSLHGTVAFGHGALRATPESLTDKQPFTDAESGLTIVADARIDNRSELVDALQLNTPQHASLADSQLLLTAYARWGARCCEKLLGDFAFAVWNSRAKELFCARDPFGVRPFFYYSDPDRFTFASELKALLTIPDIPRRLNTTLLADDLAEINDDHTATYYRDIFRLPPASTLTISITHPTATVKRYWQLNPDLSLPPTTADDYANQFREIFTDAVRCRLRTAPPHGCQLSGGLDSSAVTLIADTLLREQNVGPLHTFSAIFDGDRAYNEQAHVDAVVAQGNIYSHRITVDTLLQQPDVMQTILDVQDEPTCPVTLLVHSALYQHASNAGVRVLLDGIDGDTTVSHGLSVLCEWLRTGRWFKLGTEISQLSHRFHRSRLSFLKAYALRPLVPRPLYALWRLAHGRPPAPWQEFGFLNPDFATTTRIAERVSAFENRYRHVARSARSEHLFSLQSRSITDLIEMLNRAAAAHSLTLHHPFFDRRLVEFCLALPVDQKLKNGWTRVVMRRALDKTWPACVRARGDKGKLSPELLRGLPKLLLPFLDNDDPFEGSAPFLDKERLTSLANHVRRHPTPDNALRLWEIMPVVRWLHGTQFTT